MKMKRIAVSVMLVAAVAACTDSLTTPVPAAPSLGTVASNVSIESFSAIGQPDAAYLAETTKIDFSALTSGTPVSSITDGSRTVTFDTPMTKPFSFSGWSSPPWSESAGPVVLFSNGPNTQTLTISGSGDKQKKIQTFGFELQPNGAGTPDFTASFYNGLTLIGSVTRSVSVDGARLFALCTDEGAITRVVVAWTGSGIDPVGFSIAQVRYGTHKCATKPPKPPKP